MKSFLREIQKTWFRLPCLLLFLAALFLNGCLLYTETSGGMAGSSAYKKANVYLQGLPQEERADVLESYQNALENGEWNGEFLFSDDLLAEQLLVQEFGKRFRQIEGYPEYLQGIQDKAAQQEISIFQDTSEYTKRDLQASAEAFLPLTGKQLCFVNSDTFLHATEFQITDILVLAVLFYLVISMVVYEKEHGLFHLLRATKEGRGALIRSKMWVGAAASAVLSLFFWGENLGIAVWKYGVLELSAPLQSVYGYDGSALNISIGQYLLLFLVSKAAVYTVISFLILLLGMRARNTMGIYLGAFLAAGFSVGCYAVGVYSGFHVLHYLNLIFLVEVFSSYRFYFNLNFFQYPIPVTVLFWGCMVLFGSLFWYLNWKTFAGDNFTAEIKRGWRLRTGRGKRPNVRVVSHEMYKLLVSNRGWMLICLLVALQGWMYGQKSTRLYLDEYYYKQYMDDMEGELDEQKEEFIRQEQEMFVQYETLLAEKQRAYEEKKISEAEMVAVTQLAAQKLEPRAAFERLLERTAYAKAHDLPLLYETGYLELFGYGASGYRQDMQEAMFLVSVLILLLAPYCAGEYSQGMMKLVGSQYAGRRKTLLAKWSVGLLCSTVVYFAVYIPRIVYIGKLYGYAGMGENIDTIPEMAGGFLHCPIWTYALLIYLVRFLMMCATMVLIMAVAVNRKNIIQAVSGLLAVLVLPMGLHMMGIRVADDCSLNAFYSVNRMLNPGKSWLFVLGICILAIMLGGSVAYLMSTMGREKESCH